MKSLKERLDIDTNKLKDKVHSELHKLQKKYPSVCVQITGIIEITPISDTEAACKIQTSIEAKPLR